VPTSVWSLPVSRESIRDGHLEADNERIIVTDICIFVSIFVCKVYMHSFIPSTGVMYGLVHIQIIRTQNVCKKKSTVRE
jgi:hypothetical protein